MPDQRETISEISSAVTSSFRRRSLFFEVSVSSFPLLLLQDGSQAREGLYVESLQREVTLANGFS